MSPQEPFLIEIVFKNADLATSFEARDEIEDLLAEALAAAGIGEVTGAGTGMGKSNIDVEVADVAMGSRSSAACCRTSAFRRAPSSTSTKATGQDTGKYAAHAVYEQR